MVVVNAGRGLYQQTERPGDIWSLKWNPPGEDGVEVSPGLRVQTFLTVPEDCAVGVCAHEWGHLAARWADFYDTGRVEATTSNGLGDYCLMAGGAEVALAAKAVRFKLGFISSAEKSGSKKSPGSVGGQRTGSRLQVWHPPRIDIRSQFQLSCSLTRYESAVIKKCRQPGLRGSRCQDAELD